MKEKIKKILFFFVLLLCIVLPLSADARSGCCSWHGGVCGCQCCDGTSLSSTCLPYYPGCGGGYNPPSYDYTPSIPNCPSNSYYDSISSSCKCYSGYVASSNNCISVDQWCRNEYGMWAKYDYLTDNCGCMSGYIISGGSCINGDTLCHQKYGYYSDYDSYTKSCECDYGYVFDSRDQCVSEKDYCKDLFGSYADYDVLSDECVCQSGYVLENNKCLKINCPLNSTLIGDQCFCNNGYVKNKNICITHNQNCENEYGINSYGDNDYCYCNDGYEWNSAQTTCIKSITCPSHSSKINNKCYCDDDYEWNSTQIICFKKEKEIPFNNENEDPASYISELETIIEEKKVTSELENNIVVKNREDHQEKKDENISFTNYFTAFIGFFLNSIRNFFNKNF